MLAHLERCTSAGAEYSSSGSTKTISARGINIGAARVTTSRDQLAEQTFDVWVNDLATLNAVMKEISRIKGVLSVERVRS